MACGRLRPSWVGRAAAHRAGSANRMDSVQPLESEPGPGPHPLPAARFLQAPGRPASQTADRRSPSFVPYLSSFLPAIDPSPPPNLASLPRTVDNRMLALKCTEVMNRWRSPPSNPGQGVATDPAVAGRATRRLPHPSCAGWATSPEPECYSAGTTHAGDRRRDPSRSRVLGRPQRDAPLAGRVRLLVHRG